MRSKPEVKTLDAIVLSYTCTQRCGRLRHDFKSVYHPIEKQLRCHKRPGPVVGANVKHRAD